MIDACQNCPWGDHPRVCGEEGSAPRSSTAGRGSPPRVRGRGRSIAAGSGCLGITPARAGKSGNSLFRFLFSGDHPRACGEESCTGAEIGGDMGSPPRVRGRVWDSKVKHWRSRITPARAGKRSTRRWTACPIWDHPRACGEECGQWSPKIRGSGSPPRVRGRVPLASCRCWGLRITPARAGKRKTQGLFPQVIQDHPRACGEERWLHGSRRRSLGSPPRVRGRVKEHLHR